MLNQVQFKILEPPFSKSRIRPLLKRQRRIRRCVSLDLINHQGVAIMYAPRPPPPHTHI